MGTQSIISANQLQVTGVLTVANPTTGKALVAFQVDFTGSNNSTIVDLTFQQQGLTFNDPKTLFFDNTANPNAAQVSISNTQQTFEIPPLSAGYFPIAAQTNSRITFSSVGGATSVSNAQLFNYDIPPAVWGGFGQPVAVAGTVPVTSIDGGIVTIGTKADAAVTNPSSSASVVAILKGLLSVLSGSIKVAQSTAANLLANVFTDGVTDNLLVPITNGGAVGVLVASTSTVGYGQACLYLSTLGTSASVNLQWSYDNTNWYTYLLAQPYTAGATSNAAIGVGYGANITAPYVRVNQTGITAGTTVGYMLLKRAALAVPLGTGSVNSNSNTGYTDSTTALGSSATFTGTSRAVTNAYLPFFNACAYADQAGTLQIQQSLDSGSTFQTIASVALTAGSSQNLSVRVSGALTSTTVYRVQYVNGAAAQATFRLSSSFTNN